MLFLLEFDGYINHQVIMYATNYKIRSLHLVDKIVSSLSESESLHIIIAIAQNI